ncbi:MAG TPA: Bax inhibitor-1/YccA family protein [Aquabacterium sp.]|uniref:Bax inhibitor-1/YccA family protein n=1 Tax=Aquabacterium sp. TaxID=1872578 RepID=UPI002E37BCF4|nr:Bax inhibitor-1/YccA family protein [Aquabacterium sp.]HEX5371158.1 Bax inhibitor-1/YccA family protein [Aquabacterium sp.]
MEHLNRHHSAVASTATPFGTTDTRSVSVNRVLRNTYALLSMTLIFSALVAAASVAWSLPAPGLIITLVGYFGLLFAVHKLQNSAWSLPAVFALTGFMGYTLGPVLTRVLSLPGGADTITLALGATGVTFLAMSAWALTTRRDLSFLGGFLFAGMVIALVAGLAGALLSIPALSLAVSAMVALLSAGLILFETQQIVRGGQTNYVLATVGLYVSLFNLFTSLMSLLGLGGSDE